MFEERKRCVYVYPIVFKGKYIEYNGLDVPVVAVDASLLK